MSKEKVDITDDAKVRLWKPTIGENAQMARAKFQREEKLQREWRDTSLDIADQFWKDFKKHFGMGLGVSHLTPKEYMPFLIEQGKLGESEWFYARNEAMNYWETYGHPLDVYECLWCEMRGYEPHDTCLGGKNGGRGCGRTLADADWAEVHACAGCGGNGAGEYIPLGSFSPRPIEERKGRTRGSR